MRVTNAIQIVIVPHLAVIRGHVVEEHVKIRVLIGTSHGTNRLTSAKEARAIQTLTVYLERARTVFALHKLTIPPVIPRVCSGSGSFLALLDWACSCG